MAIYAKLLEFQKQNIIISKDAKNSHFGNSYSSLNEVLDKVKKPLNDLGVVIVQAVEADGLRTTLIDTEGSSLGDAITSDGRTIEVGFPRQVECFVPFVGAADMQKLGGAITYARRYSLVSLLGLEDEDDDGNAASTPSRSTAKTIPGTDIEYPAGPIEEPFTENPFA